MAQPFIWVSHPSCSHFGGVEEGINNFDRKQVPFWVRDCCAARQGLWPGHTMTKNTALKYRLSIPGCCMFWLLIFFFFSNYLSYYCSSIGLLSIITFYLFLLFQYSVQQGAMFCSSACVTVTLGITDMLIFNLFLRGGYKRKMYFSLRNCGFCAL